MARECLVILVILVGILTGGALIVSTIQQLRRGRRFPSASGRLHPIEALARLLLGASLVLLAAFLLAGRALWAESASISAVPAWAAPAGVAILSGVLLCATVVGGFALARRMRPKSR
jgi:hypothetical protein